jgi:hypothetical protein
MVVHEAKKRLPGTVLGLGHEMNRMKNFHETNIEETVEC